MRTLHAPGVSDIVDFADGRVKLFGMNVKRDSWFANRTVTHLAEAGPPDNCMTALIFRGQQVIIPHGAELLLPGDHIYIVTTAVNLDAAMRFMGIEAQRVVKRVLIVGGMQIGILAAEALERENVRVKLMELDAARCEKIAGIVRKTVVIHGDGTDQSTLEEENVEGVDAFLALTSHDEDNIMASLLARRMGARKVVALINRLNYLPMVQRLGINATVSPRLTTVDRVLQFVRQGAVLSVTTFREEEAEAIELIAEAGSRYVGKPLKDIRFPREAIVGAIARSDGSVVVPRGNAQIEVGDRVIFFARESVVPKLESAFLAHARRGYRRDPLPRNRLRSRTVPRDFRGNDDDPSGWPPVCSAPSRSLSRRTSAASPTPSSNRSPDSRPPAPPSWRMSKACRRACSSGDASRTGWEGWASSCSPSPYSRLWNTAACTCIGPNSRARCRRS